MRQAYLAISVLGSFLCFSVGASSQPEQRDDMPTVVVGGEAEAFAPPDIASLLLGVSALKNTAAEALDASSGTTAKVLQVLRDAGVDMKDMQTAGLFLQPRYEARERDGENKVVGYVASNRVSVTFRNISSVGNILDRLVEVGSNDIRGLSFDISDKKGLLDDARRRAVLDARRKAELYASAAGLSLSRVVSIVEEAGSARPVPGRLAPAGALSAAPIETGEVGIRVRIQMKWVLR